MPSGRERQFIYSTHDALSEEWKWVQELAHETNKLRATKRYRAWLAATAALWEYSPLNCCLIWVQRRDAKHVAGPAEWARRGRTVRQNALPLWILAPTGSGRFVGVKVYDVRDTHGPKFKIDSWMLKGGAKQLERVEAAAPLLGITLRNNTTRRGVCGVCLPGKIVEVTPGLSRAERMATLTHEYAHALLGHVEAPNKTSRSQAVANEGEAEGVAWVVAKALGVRSKAPEYLAAVGVRTMDLQKSTRRIGEAARRILRAVEGKGLKKKTRSTAAPSA